MINETRVSFPGAFRFRTSGRQALHARLQQYSLEDFKTLFSKAEASKLSKAETGVTGPQPLTGPLIADANMAKVLDGNYDDRETTGGDWGLDLTDKIFSAVFKSLCQYYRLAEHGWRPDNNARIEYYKAVRFVDDSDARSLYSALVNAFKFFPKIPEVRRFQNSTAPKLGAFTNDNFCYCCLNVGAYHPHTDRRGVTL